MAFSKHEADYREALLYKVAWLYYIDELTQKEIAEQLSLTRIKVIKLLEEARKRKVVRFHFSTYFRHKNHLEQALMTKYGLRDVLVVPWNAKENLAENLGQATAMYLNDFLPDGASIGIGYGVTIGSILKNLAKISNKKYSIVSMTGGVMPYLRQVGTGLFELNPFLIPAPLIVSKKEIAEAFIYEKAVRDVMKQAQDTKVVVTGIGGMSDNSTVLSEGILTPEEFEGLKSRGAVGDVLMHFIDEKGNLVDDDIENRIISMNLDDVKKKDNIIAAAGGISKRKAIHTALTLGLVNVLITDEDTAEALLEGVDYE